MVHDPTAWILGGISGNAGIFTEYRDLIKFMKMMLNNGTYTAEDGSTKQMFRPETVKLFITAP